MMYMQIKFLEGYTRNLTVLASREMRRDGGDERQKAFYIVLYILLDPFILP